MNVGKSIKKSLIDQDKNLDWLATKLDRSYSTVTHMSNQKTANGNNLIKLSRIFNMKVSEFIALGEDK